VPYAGSPAQREYEAYLRGTAVPARLKAVQAAATLGLLALHALIAGVTVVPHVDGWAVFATVGFLVPLPLSYFVGRAARSLVDPSIGHFNRGDEGNGVPPSIVRYSRTHAAVQLTVLLALEAAWSVWALPTMQHATRRDCPACAPQEPPPTMTSPPPPLDLPDDTSEEITTVERL